MKYFESSPEPGKKMLGKWKAYGWIDRFSSIRFFRLLAMSGIAALLGPSKSNDGYFFEKLSVNFLKKI